MQAATTIVFSTYNRCDLLRKAIVSAQKQSVPVRIIVMDDASNDGTKQMMEKEFPEIEHHRSSQNLGPVTNETGELSWLQLRLFFH